MLDFQLRSFDYGHLRDLYVAKQYRRRGVGAELIEAGVEVAQEHGYENIFAGTSTAQSIFESLNWELITKVKEGQELMVLNRYTLCK